MAVTGPWPAAGVGEDAQVLRLRLILVHRAGHPLPGATGVSKREIQDATASGDPMTRALARAARSGAGQGDGQGGGEGGGARARLRTWPKATDSKGSITGGAGCMGRYPG